MQDIDEAIVELGRLVGLSDLAFDAEGNVGLLFDSSMPVNVARINEKTAELWSPIEDFGMENDAALLRFLLIANHLGEGTGAARLSLQPDGEIVLCQRIEADSLNSATLESRFTDFVKHAFYWNSEDAREAASGTDAGQGLMDAAEQFGIRV